MLLLITVAFTACKKDEIEYRNDFETSFKAWQKFKAETGNSYSYTAYTASWTGAASETTITISNGQFVSRVYRTLRAHNQMGQPPIYSPLVEEWREEGSTLNTKQDGAPLLTLDQIYEQAKNDLLLKRPDAKTYFEAKNDGLISSAGYVEDNCADDCFRGVNIKAIIRL
ncbi:MAG: hypothetical protein V4687_08020 [Bacteroidota bacterium]